MNDLHNNQIMALAMGAVTIIAIVAMACTSLTAQTVGQPWDSSWDKPSKPTTMRVDSTMSNFEVCQAAKRLKRKGNLTGKAKRGYCKPYRQEVFLTAFVVGLTTPTYYPYYYYPIGRPNLIILNN